MRSSGSTNKLEAACSELEAACSEIAMTPQAQSGVSSRAQRELQHQLTDIGGASELVRARKAAKGRVARWLHRNQSQLPPSEGPQPPDLIFESGCRDLNPGPLDPQSSALTKLRHSPRSDRPAQSRLAEEGHTSATSPWARIDAYVGSRGVDPGTADANQGAACRWDRPLKMGSCRARSRWTASR